MSVFGKDVKKKAEEISRFLHKIEALGKKGVKMPHKAFNKKCDEEKCFAQAIIGTNPNTTGEMTSTKSIQIKGSKCQATHFEEIDKFHKELETFLKALKNIAEH